MAAEYRFDLILKSPQLKKLFRWCKFNLDEMENYGRDVEADQAISVGFDKTLTNGISPTDFVGALVRQARNALRCDVTIDGTWWCYDNIPSDGDVFSAKGIDAVDPEGCFESMVTDIIYRRRKVMLPRACPFCNANLMNERSLLIVEFKAVGNIIRLSEDEEGPDWDNPLADRTGDDSTAFQQHIACANCSHVFGEATETCVEEDSSFFEGLRSDEEAGTT